MSYCTFSSDCDVYIYESDRGVECCACRLNRGTLVLPDRDAMIAHALDHWRAGHKIPDEVITNLERDLG